MADYNGWTNYETWLYSVWDEDNQAYRTAWEVYNEGSYDLANSDDKRKFETDVAETLEEQFDNYIDSLDIAGFVLDLIHNQSINWREIASHACDSLREEQENEQ